jgi:hypothetical protein
MVAGRPRVNSRAMGLPASNWLFRTFQRTDGHSISECEIKDLRDEMQRRVRMRKAPSTVGVVP